MEHTRKMALVHPQFLNTLLAQQHVNPGLSYLGKLDQDMSTVLQNPNLPPDVKHKQFTQLRHQYSNVKEDIEKPVNITLQNAPVPLDVHDILDGLPKNAKTKGKILLQHIRRNPELEWDEKGQLIINGQLVEHSNITDLVHDFVRPIRNRPPPVGRNQFANILHTGNVPREALADPDRVTAPGESHPVRRQIQFSSPPANAGRARSLTPSVQRLFDSVRARTVTPLARRRERRTNVGPASRYGDWVTWD